MAQVYHVDFQCLNCLKKISVEFNTKEEDVDYKLVECECGKVWKVDAVKEIIIE